MAISYSSRALDGRIQDGEPGLIADGWSLAEIKIVREQVKIEPLWGEYPAIRHIDQFRLVLDGTGYELYPEVGANPISDATVRYYAKDGPGLHITRYYDPNLPTDGLYWVVKSGNGTLYRLGYTADSEEYQDGPQWFPLLTHPGDSGTRSAMAWNVDTIVDSSGNEITYHYYTKSETEEVDNAVYSEEDDTWYWYTSYITTRTSRLNQIRYNYPDRVTTLPPGPTVVRLSSTPATIIAFRASSEDNDGTNTYLNPITSVYIFHNNSLVPMKEYRLTTEPQQVESPGCWRMDNPRTTKTQVVTAIRLHTAIDNNAATLDDGYSLPAVTFDYTSLRHFNGSSDSCFSFRYLSQVNNGYGGSTNFSYTSDNRAIGSYNWYTGRDTTQWPTLGYSYYVSQISSQDGRNPAVVSEYSYSGPCYGQASNTNGVPCGAPGAPEFGPLVGFAATTQTNRGFANEILNRQVTTFSQDASKDLGRPLQVDSGLVSNGNLVVLQRVLNSYTKTNVGPTTFTYLAQTSNYHYHNGVGTTNLSGRVEYDYNPSYQGGAQYGNLTETREYDSATATTAYRVTTRRYYPNPTTWLVNFVAQEAIYAPTNVPDTLLAGTWYYYDSNTNPQQSPSQGRLIRTRRLVPVDCTEIDNGGGPGCAYARKTVDTTVVYDSFGNQISLTSYGDYGYRTFNSSWAEILNAYPGQPRTTTIVYETAYRLYPVSVTDPAGQTTTFEIYGFNGVALSGFQRQRGLLRRVTAPNGAHSAYEYDPFGRLVATYDDFSMAGFDDVTVYNGDPVELYRYWDNNWNNGTLFLNPAGNAPFVSTVQRRPGSYAQPANAAAGYAFNEQTFFDGFGRPIQSRSIWNWVEDQSRSREIVSHTAYGANGQVSCQSAPYDVAFYSDRGLVWPTSPFLTQSCTGKPHVATTYDGLGRPLTSTAPDGSTSQQSYAIVSLNLTGGTQSFSQTSFYDGNNHRLDQLANSLGQLAAVREYSGQSNHALYATTLYAYDVLGNLISVKDNSANITSLTYDGLGRKLTMNDPDMGYWEYGYDPAGNILNQEDNAGQLLCFSYDVLNRLTAKRHDTTANGCETTDLQLAAYTYHTSGGGKGQVSQIFWSNSATQNKESFGYDSLGRLTTHNRWVDGRLYSQSYSNFDPFHRPTGRTLIYPNGNSETVTTTFDHEGENGLTAGGTSLVTAVGYNDQGQLKRLALGNNLTTWFGYKGYEASANNDLYDSRDAYWWGDGDQQYGRLWRICTAPNNNANCLADHKDIFNGGQLLDLRYGYDPVGNITAIRDHLNVEVVDNQNIDQLESFTYDHLNRLVTAGTNGVGVGQYSHNTGATDYNYNQIGNLTAFGNNTSYDYGTWSSSCGTPPGQTMPHAVRQIGSQYFCYDSNGNMTTRFDGTTLYLQSFNVENELTSVSVSGQTTSFAYDANGLRTKTSEPGNKTTYTPFPGVEEEVVGSTTTRRVTYSLAGQAIALRVQIVGGSNTVYHLHTDHLGSTRLMSDSNGDDISGSTTRYYPFGDWRTEPTAGLTDRGYTGHQSNNLGSGPTDLGLIYMNARYYAPGLGRFISADTIVPDPSNPQSHNRYSYVLNSPLLLFDPTGHYAQFSMIFETGPDWYANQMYEHAMSDAVLMNILGIAMPDAVPTAVEIAARIIFEPIDWVASGIEIYMAVQEGDYLTAGITAVGAAIPFVSGRAVSEGFEFIAKHGDDIGDFFQHADDLPAFPCGIGHSFSAETVVATPDGLIPISQLVVGDEVLAYDEQVGENEYQPIEATWVHLDPLIVHLTINGETIETTPNHPFYTDQGWVEAEELWVGAAIYTAHGDYGYVQTIELAPHPQPMYDLTVATAHTYFVGDGQWLVHNCDTDYLDFLPVRNNKSDPTSGLLLTDNEAPIFLESGWNGPALGVPKGTSGFDMVTRTHVEGHAAALMHQEGWQNATLYINNIPCSSCDRLLTRMLPQGASLRVLGINGFDKLYR